MKISKVVARQMCMDAGLSRKDYARLKLREGMSVDAVQVLISAQRKHSALFAARRADRTAA